METLNGGEEIIKELIDMARYIFAYDPTIKRRVTFIVENGWAISMVTGYRFRYHG